MGFLDKAKDKLTEVTDSHPDTVEQYSDQGIERAGDAVDERTGGQHAEHVDRAQRAADDHIGER